MEDMQNKEIARMILELRDKGMTDTEIINLILYMETGEDKYKTNK